METEQMLWNKHEVQATVVEYNEMLLYYSSYQVLGKTRVLVVGQDLGWLIEMMMMTKAMREDNHWDPNRLMKMAS